MTDEQINIAIAESLGWDVFFDTLCNITPDHNGEPVIEPIEPLPNYTSDLDAMHEAMLLHPRKDLLRKFLYLEVLEDPTNTTNEPAWATAKQWAIAYVKSLGKWEE
jgi:hypothetical protein